MWKVRPVLEYFVSPVQDVGQAHNIDNIWEYWVKNLTEYRLAICS
jgi:hypothetical protein